MFVWLHVVPAHQQMDVILQMRTIASTAPSLTTTPSWSNLKDI